MRTIIAGILSVALLGSLAASNDAEGRAAKNPRRHDDSYARKYPSAAPRQLRNARAYDRGDYSRDGRMTLRRHRRGRLA
jgi:hypothetical protein